MNTKILQKCVEALNSEKPDISYIRGMLETLIEISGATVPLSANPTVNVPVTRTETVADEDEEIARKYAAGPIGRITT